MRLLLETDLDRVYNHNKKKPKLFPKWTRADFEDRFPSLDIDKGLKKIFKKGKFIKVVTEKIPRPSYLPQTCPLQTLQQVRVRYLTELMRLIQRKQH